MDNLFLAIIAIIIITTVFIYLKQSYIVGVILTGMIFTYFNIFQPNEIKFFSSIGILLLMFLIGMEFDIRKIGKSAFSIVIIASIKFLFIFAICYQIFLLLFSPDIAIFLSIAFTFSSTAIVAKIAEERNILKEKDIQIMIGVLVIEDIIVVILMALTLGTGDIKFSIVKIFLLLVLSYFLLLKIIDKIFEFFIKKDIKENILLFTIAICIIMAGLTNFIGFSEATGAFIAGNLVGSTRHSETIKKIFEPFTVLFIILFFFSVGMMIHLEAIISAWAIIIFFIILNFILKFYTVSFTYYSLEYDKDKAIRSGAIMISISEFSLVLLINAMNKEIINNEILSAFGIAFVVSAFLSSVALNEKIFKKIHVLIPKSSIMKNFALKTYETKNAFEEEITKKVYMKGRSLWKDATGILIVFAVSYLIYEYGYQRESIILLILSLPFIIDSIIKIGGMIMEILKVLHSFMIITKTTKKRIIGNIIMIGVFYVVLLQNFLILSFFHIQFMHSFFSFFFILAMLFFIYDTIYVIATNKMTNKIINIKDINDYIEKIIGIKKI